MTPTAALTALAGLAVVGTSELPALHHRRFRDYLDRWPDPCPDPAPATTSDLDPAAALRAYQSALGALVAGPDAGLSAIARRCLVEVHLAWPEHAVHAGLRPTYALRVSDVRRTGRDGVRIELELPPPLQPRFRHLAGQHVKVVHPTAGVVQHRSYSLCTGPTSVAATGRLVLGVRALPDSFVSATLRDPPEQLWVSPPHGAMVWPPGDAATSDAPLLLCGVGSGITPVLAIADEALRASRSRVDLVVVDRGPDDAMLLQDAAALAAEHPGRLGIHPLWTRSPVRNPVTADRVAARLAAIAPDPQAAAYVCGASDPVRLVVAALADLGITEIRHESFDTSRRARVETPPRPGGTVTVDPGDGPVRVDVRPGESLLVALIGLGREPAYSCLSGTCGECEITLVAGSVAPSGTTPDPRRIRACVTAPAARAD